MRRLLTGRAVFVFPGQGSQHAEMGRELALTDAGRRAFAIADDVVGYRLSALCIDGSVEALTRTEHTQPAIFTVSHIAARLLEERGYTPHAAAGHSVGEYAALVTAGALSFEEGLRLVQRRGELMAAVAERTPGAMAAIVGLDAEAVADICRRASAHGVVEIANYNDPEQIVISGESAAIDTAMDLADEADARAVLRLNVSAPFHCRLMRAIECDMAAAIAAADIRAPRIPVVANITADYVDSPDDIRRALMGQLAGSVRWAESIARLAADGAGAFVEAGPGRVLSRLNRQIAPAVRTMTTAEALDGAAAAR